MILIFDESSWNCLETSIRDSERVTIESHISEHKMSLRTHRISERRVRDERGNRNFRPWAVRKQRKCSKNAAKQSITKLFNYVLFDDLQVAYCVKLLCSWCRSTGAVGLKTIHDTQINSFWLGHLFCMII